MHSPLSFARSTHGCPAPRPGPRATPERAFTRRQGARKAALLLGALAATTAGCSQAARPTPRDRHSGAPAQGGLVAAYGGEDLGALPLWVADRLGFFQAEGLRVRLVRLPHAAVPSPMLRLQRGEIQFLTISMDLLEWDLGCCDATVRTRGVYVAAATPTPVFSLLARPALQTVARLRGQRIAASGEAASAAHYALKVILNRHGLHLHDVQVVSGLAAPQVLRQLLAGELDAAVLPPPMSLQAAGHGLRRLADAAAYGMPYPAAWLATDRVFARRHAAPTTGFLRAYLRGLQAARLQAQTAVAVVAATLGLDSTALAAATYRAYRPYLAADPEPPIAGVRAALAMIARVHPRAATQVALVEPAAFVQTHWLRAALGRR